MHTFVCKDNNCRIHYNLDCSRIIIWDDSTGTEIELPISGKDFRRFAKEVSSLVGKKINIKGTELLVLDEIDENNFLVICLNTGIKIEFGHENNDYRNSILKKKCEEWLKEKGFSVVPRTIDLVSDHPFDGYSKYIWLM